MSLYDFAVYLLPDKKEDREEMLYVTASAYTGLDRDLFLKAVGEKGKPYFTSPENLKFSISHSGAYWACAFGTQEVGLDLQRHDDCRRESIANRFFHEDEKRFLKTKAYAPEDFFELWVKKESYVKFTGQGLGLGFENFSVLAEESGRAFLQIPFKEGYSLCICAEKLGKVELRVLGGINK